MKMIVLGDICPTDLNSELFQQKNADLVFCDTLSHIQSADFSIANLECPLTEADNPIEKSGPNMRAPSTCIAAIKAAGIQAASLANNHIRDYGDDGVRDMLSNCQNAGILTVGAGRNAQEAGTPLLINKDGLQIAILSFADHEWSIADAGQAGANGWDMYESFDQIQELSSICDGIIVLYHSGLEHYEYPSPELQRRCRKMIEKGATAVICQHSHCIGSYENYNDGLIVYGQGNFLFAKSNKGFKWNAALMIELVMEKGSKPQWSFIPTIMQDNIVQLAKDDKKVQILTELEERSNSIGDQAFIHQKWHEFNAQRKAMYASILLGWPRVLYLADKVLGNKLSDFVLNRKKRMVIQNVIRCESHRESLEYVMGLEKSHKHRGQSE